MPTPEELAALKAQNSQQGGTPGAEELETLETPGAEELETLETPGAEELETLETPGAEDPRDAEIERLKRQLAQNEADKEEEVAAEVQKRIDQSENPFSSWVVPEKEKHLYHLGIQRGEKFDQKTSKIIKSNFYVQSFNVPEFKQMQNLGNFAALKYVILHNPETEESEK